MNLIRSTKTRLVFQLGKRETDLLLHLSKLYPAVPAAHQRLSKMSSPAHPEENQRLLDEALAHQRAGHRKSLDALLADPARWKEHEDGRLLSLARAETEWLMQVLNDIRVGSWIRLGSPETLPRTFDETTAPDFLAMELAGYFQMRLLEALGGGE